MLYGPIRAKQLRTSSGRKPGTCRIERRGPGLFITHGAGPTLVDEHSSHLAVELLVLTEHGLTHVPDIVPFIIDTGTPRTLIPKHLIPALVSLPVVGGKQDFVESFGTEHDIPIRWIAASLTLQSPDCREVRNRARRKKPEVQSIVFGKMPVGIVDCPFPVALLGLDALRHLKMVLDDDHVTLWQSRHQRQMLLTTDAEGASDVRNPEGGGADTYLLLR
ncbi:hypothetical protein LCGC14_1233350 [marine sediment metagenome]|uniref:Uncharacterized protein n=1 Tax=marine sediment metagenome TaxID=412755 RepID=A0A0F9PC64_9ZZZZ